MVRRARLRGAGASSSRKGTFGDVLSGDWVAPCGKLAGDGTLTLASVWGAPLSQASGAIGGPVLSAFALALLPPSSSAPPVIGVADVSRVEGDVGISTILGSFKGTYLFQYGIHVTEFIASTGKWLLLNPSLGSEAARDEWIWLESRVIEPAPPTATGLQYSGFRECNFRMSLPMNVRLGGGQGLAFVFSLVDQSPAAGTGVLYIYPNVRTYLRRVV